MLKPTTTTPTTPTTIVLYRRRWVILTIFALSQFLCALYRLTFASISTVLLDYYHIPFDTWKVNSLAMCYMIAFVPTSIVSSFVQAKIGLRASVFIAVSLNFVGGCIRFAGFKQGHEAFFWILLGGQCITAFAQPFIGNATTLLASNWFGDKERTIATTIAAFCSVLGSAAAFGIAPWLAGDESEKGMIILLGGEAAFAAVLLVSFVAFFQDKPPTPPSYSHVKHVVHQQQHLNVNESEQVETTEVTDQEEDEDERSSVSAKFAAAIDLNPGTINLNSPSFINGFLTSIKNIHFLILLFSFAMGYGVVQTFVTFLDQIIVPMGYSVHDGSLFGIVVVVSGVLGAVVIGIIADYTKKYKLLLCFSGIAAVGAFAFFTVTMLYDRSPVTFAMSCLSLALLGMFASPTIPLILQMSVECTFPVPESTTNTILNAVGTIVTSVCILVLDAVEKDKTKKKTGSMKTAMWIMLGLLALAIAVSFLFNSPYKRLAHERQIRQQKEEDINSSETEPILIKTQ
jgi:MFS family permease